MNKILVVEDDESTAELINFTLRSHGFDVALARDGGSAIKKVKSYGPDLIVLDIMLPIMDGFQVCEIIKHDALYRNIPIIMLSAKIRREDISKGLEMGADEYMTKPFEPSQLVEKVIYFLTKTTVKKEN
jgi:DNA-binding response OmpR family regulator